MSKWNEENITEGIMRVREILKMERMPTNQEVVRVEGNYALGMAIQKSGGYRAWSKKLNLDLMPCESMMGYDWETKAAETITELGFGVSRMTVRHPFDLLVGSFVRIDVKASKMYRGPHGEFYTFNLEKNPGTCDMYVCYCVLDNGNVDKVLVIPAAKAKITQLSVGQYTSKWDIYKDRWDYIDTFNEFHAKLMSS